MKAVMWLLTTHGDDTDGPDWHYHNNVCPGPTAQDAMKALVTSVKEQNARYEELARQGGYEFSPDEIPDRAWAVPFSEPTEVMDVPAERKYEGEAFRGMWAWLLVEEVRL